MSFLESRGDEMDGGLPAATEFISELEGGGAGMGELAAEVELLAVVPLLALEKGVVGRKL